MIFFIRSTVLFAALITSSVSWGNQEIVADPGMQPIRVENRVSFFTRDLVATPPVLNIWTVNCTTNKMKTTTLATIVGNRYNSVFPTESDSAAVHRSSDFRSPTTGQERDLLETMCAAF
jgi:hypothetical protein